jgi:cob(I)alamin adenosyltransferase
MTDNQEQAKATRHKERMQRKKAIIDEKVAKASEERGVIILLKGNGKGKSSSAFGMLARSLGHGMNAGVVQFIKGKWRTGEEIFFENHPDVDYQMMRTGFTWDTQDRGKDTEAARETWQQAQRMLQDPGKGLVLLDELTYMFKFDYLPLEEVLNALHNRPSHQNVVITGRTAPTELEELADTVSEVRDIKHAFRAGVKAQAGIEW